MIGLPGILLGMVHISLADIHCAEASFLLGNLLAELTRRYPEEEADNAVPANVDGPRGAFVIAWLDGLAAGCGALREMEPTVAEIKRMYVEPLARRHGIARLLLTWLESIAQDYGYTSVRLETGIRQPEAVRLYESAGYQHITCYGKYAGSALSICFEKRLTGAAGRELATQGRGL